jgi:5-methylcytosine-specific restriction endonuclease McrA
MGRLRMMASPVAARTAQPRVRVADQAEVSSRSRLYSTARWQALRWSVLVEAMFTCAMCRKVEGDGSKLVADHKVPHRGDEQLFWDRGNLQCLCKRCHDSDKQREETRGRS